MTVFIRDHAPFGAAQGPVENPGFKKYLKEDVLQAYLRDNVNARELQPDGSYARIPPVDGVEPFDSQMYFEGFDLNS